MIEQQFLELMLSHGFNPGQIISDAKYHRFPIKQKDRDGYYNLTETGYGVFGNWKTGDQYKFRAGKSEQMTEQERLEIQAKYKEELRKNAAEKENLEAKAAAAACKLWDESADCPADHAYLKNKQIQPHGVKIDTHGALLVPIYDGNKIVNLQRVTVDSKRFMPSAKKKGCYGKLEGSADVIFIVEGFATGASVNEATGKLCIIALDAGNLLPVAKAIRKKYGVGQKIIIAGDDDQWTEAKGEKHNTGRIEATKAAGEIYADVKFTDFPENGQHYSDWNDYACVHGLEAVAKKLLPVVSVAISAKQDVVVEELEFDLDNKGRPRGTIENLACLVQQRKIVLRYNVIKKQEEILIPDESYSLDNSLNAAYARILSFCKEEDMPTSQLGDFLTYLCDKAQYNPVTTWILSKPWDGHSRIKEFFDTVQAANNEIKELILTRWMVSAVASAFSPHGLATRGVLVFQGEQYLGKTSWFKKLVPPELDVRKDGYILRLDDKDNVFQCLSHWLIELGELEATFKKSDIAQLKAFIPMDKDILRRPYARKDSQYARRTVFFASVNQKEFLFDETGNTRFWSIETISINYNHNIDMQQLWAEFYALYLNDEPYVMSTEEIKMINTNNEDFMGADYHDELIARKFVWEDTLSMTSWKTSTEIAQIVGIQNPKQQDLNRISKAVRKHNGDQYKRDKRGNRVLLVARERGMYDD